MDISASTTATQTALTGLLRARADLNDAAQSVAEKGPDVRSAVAVAQSETNFQASAAVLKTANEMERSLLDIIV